MPPIGTTTTTDNSLYAFYAAFYDVCSPYYNYAMMACGIPSIEVWGTDEDWHLLASKWHDLQPLFAAHQEWFDKVGDILDKCHENLDYTAWWKSIFNLEKCGSGSDVEVQGWYSELFFKQPKLRYPRNFSTCVEYEQLDTGKEYVMHHGLFYSHQEGANMIPDFGFTIHEKVPVEPEYMYIESQEIKATENKLKNGWTFRS